MLVKMKYVNTDLNVLKMEGNGDSRRSPQYLKTGNERLL
jgi:hypothetical protein